MSKPWRWATDFDKHCLTSNFEKRGWQRVGPEEEWNFFWATKQTVQRLFDPANGFRFADFQMINHFPNHWELTRKDFMVKNIKRYRKELEKEGHPLAERSSETGRFLHLDIVPDTFQLPGDMSVFLEEFKRSPTSSWIVKPSASSQVRIAVVIVVLNVVFVLDSRIIECLCINVYVCICICMCMYVYMYVCMYVCM